MTLQFRKQPVDLAEVDIETTRLHLRPISRPYTQEVFENFTPDITKYMLAKSPGNISETEAFIEEALTARAQCTDLHLIICQRGSQEFLGVCGLHGQENSLEPELGIWLKKSAHGYRYGVEAVEALVRWATRNLQCDHFMYPVDRENIASRKIAEHLGGVMVRERKIENMSGRTLDEIVYRIQPISGELGVD